MTADGLSGQRVMSDVDRLLTELRDALIHQYRAIDDPLDRIDWAKRRGTDAEGLVTLCADMRARAAAELHVDGWSYGKIATALGLSRSAPQHLVKRGRAVEIRLTAEGAGAPEAR